MEEKDVIGIREAIARGDSWSDVSSHYGVSIQMAQKIANGDAYARFGGPIRQPRRVNRVTREEAVEILRLREGGMSYDKISARVGISATAVGGICRSTLDDLPDAEHAPGYPGYLIADDGTLFAMTACKVKVMSTYRNKDGYVMADLYKDKKKEHVRVHRLVLLAYGGDPPEGKPSVCHRDGNPENNSIDNLYWGDALDNYEDTMRHNRHARPRSLTAEQVREIRKRAGLGETKASLGREYGVSESVIGAAVRRKTYAWVD